MTRAWVRNTYSMEEQNKEDIIARYMEKDAELLKENGIDPQQERPFNKRYLKFVGVFLAIIVAGIVAIPFVGNYIKKEEAKRNIEAMDALYKRDLAIREQLRNDTDGGKTPEETLTMFIAALKADDIEKAKLYYSLYPENRSAMFKQRLDQLKEEGKISSLIDLLGKVKYQEGGDSQGYMSYVYKNNDGTAAITIDFDKALQFSDIWKIKNLSY